LDDFIRGSADCLDRRVHCVSRGRRADPPSTCARRDLAYSALCDGYADNLNPSVWEITNPSDSTAEFIVEHRQEQGVRRDLTVQVSGRDAKGGASHKVSTPAISARWRTVIWAILRSAIRRLGFGGIPGQEGTLLNCVVRDSDSDLKSQAAVQRLEKEECPWSISGTLSFHIAERYPRWADKKIPRNRSPLRYKGIPGVRRKAVDDG
jgi:hypothetical protein